MLRSDGPPARPAGPVLDRSAGQFTRLQLCYCWRLLACFTHTELVTP